MKRLKAVLVTAIATALTGTMALTTAQANTGPVLSGALTHAQYAALTTGQKAVLNQPVDAIANAVGEQGRGAYADIYSNLTVDPASGRVTVYVTDLARAKAMLADARHAHPGIDLARVTVLHASWNHKQLDAAAEKITTDNTPARAADLTVYSAAPNPDGSGIHVTAKPGTAGQLRPRLAQAAPGIPVTVVDGKPFKANEWRWNDSAPFIGGDVLLGDSRAPDHSTQCTSGIAAEDANGEDYILTADHCYAYHTMVFGEGDPTGQFGIQTGHYIGYVANNSAWWDAEIIDTGKNSGWGSNSDESDQPQGLWYPVDKAAYSYNGQSVCQDGARTYYTRGWVPCGITVTYQDTYVDLTWSDGTTHTARGVEGSGDYTCIEGDSGALVFALESSTSQYREARGQVSASSDTTDLFWTEAPDILNRFNLSINPFL